MRSFFSSYFSLWLLFLFTVLHLRVSIVCAAHWLLWISHCSMVRHAVNLVSYLLGKDDSCKPSFPFFSWICKCPFDGSQQQTHPGWVLVLDLPCLFVPSDRCFPSAFLHPLPTLIFLWSLQQQAMCSDSGNWPKDGKFTLTWLLYKETIVFNSFLGSVVENNKGVVMMKTLEKQALFHKLRSRSLSCVSSL